MSKNLTGFAVFMVVVCAAMSSVKAKERTLEYGGFERHYIIEMPQMVIDALRLPVIIVLHGGGGNAESAARMTGFTEKAVPRGFIVVYPDGSGRSRRGVLETWNAGHCCGYAMKNKVDDVGFISALIDNLVAKDNADPRRIYVTGMSNGAMMTQRLGIELSGKIAAIAPVVGGLFGDEPQPTYPVSALIINGRLDESVPLKGGQTGGRFPDAWDGTDIKPAPYQGRFWAVANGCDPKPNLYSEKGGAVTVETYDCPEGRDVVRYVVNDQGHAWPNGGKGSRLGDEPSKSMDATEVMIKFFAEHSKLISSSASSLAPSFSK